MAIYTPRGLKIRLSLEYTFALMARLYPRTDAFTILKTTEGLELTRPLLTSLAGLVCFYAKFDPYQTIICVTVISLAGTLMINFGAFVLPGLPQLSTIFSYISGYGIVIGALIIYGYLSVGFAGIIAFAVSLLIARLIAEGIGLINSVRIRRRLGIVLTTSEINFLNAYRLHASKLGVSTDITIADSERPESNWRECYIDLAKKWPEVVTRFTNE